MSRGQVVSGGESAATSQAGERAAWIRSAGTEDVRSSLDPVGAPRGDRGRRVALGFLERTLGAARGAPIESTDPYTQGHCSRVARYACMLAEAAGVPKEVLRWFRVGALLHDVGKMSVPPEILTKRGPLDDSEWAIMSRHPELGVELLNGIELPWDVRPMIRHHHERWDGTGYPDGLAGRMIPFEARILTIVDIYDALTTTRSYRPAFSHERAMSTLRAETGATVDPDLFPLFEREVVPRIRAAEGMGVRAVSV